MVFILPLTMSYNQLQVNANIASKPLTITAKKVAKDLAKDSAVAMANEIVSNYLVRELIEGATTDDGYAAVCMDGAKDNIKDCPADKRAQVKKQLTSSDRSKLASTVENVLEKKTNTSHKWQKFLDFFIPIFLISGLVATFDAMMDGDSESLIDEIAQESLISTGLLKSLAVTENKSWTPKDFTPYVKSVSVKNIQSTMYDVHSVITISVIPGKSFIVKHGDDTTTISGAKVLTMTSMSGYVYVSGTNKKMMYATGNTSTFHNGSGHYSTRTAYEYKSDTFESDTAKAYALGNAALMTYFNRWIAGTQDINDILNTWFGNLNTLVPVTIEVSDLTMPEVETNYGTQTGLNKTKNPDGTKTLPGVDSFTYTYNNNYIYPASDSTTGWKDKTTGTDVTVVEDDVIVEDGTAPVDPDTPPDDQEQGEDDPNTDKDKDKVKDKSRKWSALLTDKFPFSLPWDFLHLMGFLYADPMTPKYEIKGTEKIPLNFTIDLKFFDPYAPWFRSFIFISFVVSVIFMHGRFMGGAK